MILAGYGPNFLYFFAGYALTNHIVAVHTFSSAMDCAFQCVATPHCISYNFMKPEQQSNNCELSDKIRSWANSGDYIQRQGSVYYEDSMDVSFLLISGYCSSLFTEIFCKTFSPIYFAKGYYYIIDIAFFNLQLFKGSMSRIFQDF